MNILKVLQNIKEFHLHDGIIENIIYDASSGNLDIYAELANTSPIEMGSRGVFRFLNVELISSIDDIKKIDWDDETLEIATVGYSPQHNQDNQEGVEWFIRINYFTNKMNSDYITIIFITSGFTWNKDHD